MTFKEIILGFILMYAVPTGVHVLTHKDIDGYSVHISKSEIATPEGNILYDKNNDGQIDRKYRLLGAPTHGVFAHDLPISDEDRKTFSDITSRL